MKNSQIKTDDLSFEKYLNSLDHCSLIEHARENLLDEIIAYVILENDYLHKDCLAFLIKQKLKLPNKMVKPFLAKELNVANEETIIELMVQVFSKKLIIDTLLEYTDEDARIDIIENQNSWNKQIIFDINYN
jgi:hypothetical protein